MGTRRGYTRRGVLGAGAAALGSAACGDDYFEPSTEHGSDAPNTLLIVTDSTRADYIGAYNPDARNRTPNLDALANDSLTFSLAVPEAMPTGPARGDRCSRACARFPIATRFRQRACRPSRAGSRSPTTSRSSPR